MLLKIISLIFITFSTLANCDFNTHHVVLIHGVGSDPSTFGSLNEVLESNLKEKCIKSYSFQYETGNSFFDTHDFANHLDQWLAQNVETNFRKNDELSFISHSQGGIIGRIWMVQAISGYSKTNLLNSIRNFITLSSPSWGASISTHGMNIFFPGNSNDSDISPFGKKELNDMIFASENILRMIDYHKLLFTYKHKINFVDYAGLARHTNGNAITEGDKIVPIYSSRANFIYAKEENGHFHFDQINYSKFNVVNAVHSQIFSSNAPAISFVEKICENLSLCKSPILKRIMAIFNNAQLEKDHSLLKKLVRFRVNFYVRAQSSNISSKDIKIRVLKKDSQIRIPVEIRLPGAHATNTKIHQDNLGSVTFEGIAKNKFDLITNDFKNSYITVEVSAKGFHPKLVKVLIKPTYSTIVEMKLKEK